MIFPYPEDSNIDMEKELSRLAQNKNTGRPFIHRYLTDNKRCIQILSWKDHQSPHHTEKESKIPPPHPEPPPHPPKDKDKDKDYGKCSSCDPDVKEPLNNSELTVKRKHGEFFNVFLTKSQYDKLLQNNGELTVKECIEEFSSWMKANGKNKKDHYAALLNWIKENKRRKGESKFI